MKCCTTSETNASLDIFPLLVVAVLLPPLLSSAVIIAIIKVDTIHSLRCDRSWGADFRSTVSGLTCSTHLDWMLSGAAIYFRADLALRFLVTEVKLASDCSATPSYLTCLNTLQLKMHSTYPEWSTLMMALSISMTLLTSDLAYSREDSLTNALLLVLPCDTCCSDDSWCSGD